jgi:hypothetical protein
MAFPETIRVVVKGPNAQTFSVPASIPSLGTTTVNIPLTGVNLGTDIVQAFLDVFDFSSNQAQVTWQPTNGPISVSPVSVFFQKQAGSNSIVNPGLGPSGFTNVLTVNSLMFNTHPNTIFPGNPNGSENTSNPMLADQQTVTGTYSSSVPIPGDTGGPILLSMVAEFVVAHAGTIDFTSYSNQGYIIGCPGATFAGGSNTFSGVTNTPIQNYPALAGRNGDFPGTSNTVVDNFSLNFPAPGRYPFEIIFASGPFSERQFNLLANSAMITPIALVTTPPAPAAGTSFLQLTPTNAGPDIQGNTQTFTLTISGINIFSVPFIPVLEGHAGTLFIGNSGTTLFNFPAIPGGAGVNFQAALSSGMLAISGNNGEWQGRVALGTNGVDQFLLNFNGAAVDAGVQSTALTVTAADIAWFDSGNNSFDVYGVTSTGGGSSTTVNIFWLVMATIASVSPSTLVGNGSKQTVTVSLAKPLPPLQTNIQTNFQGEAGLVINEVLLNLNSAGFVTGWTLTVTPPIVPAGTQVGINVSGVGSQTFLSGTTFVTENVVYFNESLPNLTVN